MGTDHRENRVGGSTVWPRVNETLTPKPRTDTKHALTKICKKNRQRQIQAHKPICMQIYRKKREEFLDDLLMCASGWVGGVGGML